MFPQYAQRGVEFLDPSRLGLAVTIITFLLAGIWHGSGWTFARFGVPQ